jgi:hypothetical protein
MILRPSITKLETNERFRITSSRCFIYKRPIMCMPHKPLSIIILQGMSNELKENSQIYHHSCKRSIHQSLRSGFAADSCNHVTKWHLVQFQAGQNPESSRYHCPFRASELSFGRMPTRADLVGAPRPLCGHATLILANRKICSNSPSPGGRGRILKRESASIPCPASPARSDDSLVDKFP